MKKFLVILASVIVAAITISLTTSCQKDINLAKSLANTAWGAQDGEEYNTLTFNSQSKCTLDVEEKLGGHRQYPGTYILTGGKNSLTGETITITFETKWGDLDVASGEFTSENTLRLNNVVYERLLK